MGPSKVTSVSKGSLDLRRLSFCFFFASRRRHTRWNCDWSSDVCSSDLSAVDRLPIHVQPRADVEKNLLHFLRDCAVRAWTDVQQQIAIFADDIYQLMDHELRRFEGVVLDVAPGFVTYRGVGLPIERTDIAKLSAFQVEHGTVFLHGIVLIIDYSDVVTVLERTVVVKGGELGEIWPYQSLSDPPIEVDNVGMIFLHNFRTAREPVVGPCRRDVSEVIVKRGVRGG